MEDLFKKISMAHKSLNAAGEVASKKKDIEEIDDLLELSVDFKRLTVNLKYEIEQMEKFCDDVIKQYPLKNTLTHGGE